MTTIETFTALFGNASEAVKQRLADVVLGARLATEGSQNNGDLHNDPKNDSRLSRDRGEVKDNQLKEEAQ